MLTHNELAVLRNAIVTAQLANSREALLSGINPTFRNTLPTSAVPGQQVLMDLDAMNNAGVLVDQSFPLIIWLSNACHLVGGRQEFYVFNNALARLNSNYRPLLDRSVPPHTRRGMLVAILLLITIIIPISVFVVLKIIRQPESAFDEMAATGHGEADSTLSSASTFPGRWVRLSLDCDWRIKSVAKQTTGLKFTLQIKNRSTRSSGFFVDFSRHPLVIIDLNGSYYEMTDTSEKPSGVVDAFSGWKIQGDRVLDLDVYTQPLTNGVNKGRILYKYHNHAVPLEFAL